MIFFLKVTTSSTLSALIMFTLIASIMLYHNLRVAYSSKILPNIDDIMQRRWSNELLTDIYTVDAENQCEDGDRTIF
jgi:hypothetical protein